MLKGCCPLASRIPFGVSCIGKEAFFECEQLETVTIPDSVTRIEEGAFWRCRRLKDVQIPASVTSVGDRAFLECGISEGTGRKSRAGCL